MIHFLTIGVFSMEPFLNERQVRILKPLEKEVVDSLIRQHNASPEEFTFEADESGIGYRSITLRYIPPTSINALKVARDLCRTVLDCIAIDLKHGAIVADEDFYPHEQD